MAFTIPELKEFAAGKGFELIVLEPGEKLPENLRGRSFKRTWLCVPAGLDEKLIYAAAAHFAKVYTYGSENESDETDSSAGCNEAEMEYNTMEMNENEMDH
jgi:hypothetical protein